jgi:DNA-binding Lrp family transcriptional regulator
MDEKDIHVLASISADPVGSLSALARSSGMTQRSFSERLRLLGERGILYPGFARANMSYSAVGLENVLVLADVPPSHRSVFEAACDAHPYTQYRIRCLGRLEASSFLALFSIPAGSKSGLVAFLEALRQEGILSKFGISTPIARSKRTEYNFAFYDFMKGVWNVDWEAWHYTVETGASRFENLPRSVLHLLDSTDVMILRLLSMDARTEKRKIADKVGIEDYDLSRRLSLYRKYTVIDSYRVVHDRNIAGYALTVAVAARTTMKVAEKLSAGLAILPFPATFYPLEKGFVYVGNIPPAELGKLDSALGEYVSSVELSTCDYASSMKYHFDNEPSNYKPGYGWIDTREYMVDEPIAAILAAQKNQDRSSKNKE